MKYYPGDYFIDNSKYKYVVKDSFIGLSGTNHYVLTVFNDKRSTLTDITVSQKELDNYMKAYNGIPQYYKLKEELEKLFI